MDDDAALYSSYMAFKGWDERDNVDLDHEYRWLLRLTGKSGTVEILDIGFGQGGMLDWARAQGHRTHGVEIIPELMESAEARGHDVRARLADFGDSQFDVITAIDVLEHLPPERCMSLFAQVRQLLRADGVFIARFPNGQSPFSGALQNGDLTHIHYFAPNSIRQAAEIEGLTLTGVYNPRPIPPGLKGVKFRAAYLFRDLVEVMIGFAYFGHRFPMDPNVVVLLRCRHQTHG